MLFIKVYELWCEKFCHHSIANLFVDSGLFLIILACWSDAYQWYKHGYRYRIQTSVFEAYILVAIQGLWNFKVHFSAISSACSFQIVLTFLVFITSAPDLSIPYFVCVAGSSEGHWKHEQVLTLPIKSLVLWVCWVHCRFQGTHLWTWMILRSRARSADHPPSATSAGPSPCIAPTPCHLGAVQGQAGGPHPQLPLLHSPA